MKGFSNGCSTLSLVQLCLRREKAHAIVRVSLQSTSLLIPSPFFASYHVTCLHFTTCYNSSPQHPLSATTIHPFYQVYTILRLPFSFFPSHTHSCHKYFQLPYQLSLDPQGLWRGVKSVDACQKDETEKGAVQYSECGLTTKN